MLSKCLRLIHDSFAKSTSHTALCVRVPLATPKPCGDVNITIYVYLCWSLAAINDSLKLRPVHSVICFTCQLFVCLHLLLSLLLFLGWWFCQVIWPSDKSSSQFMCSHYRHDVTMLTDVSCDYLCFFFVGLYMGCARLCGCISSPYSVSHIVSESVLVWYF